jgi:peptidoglycan/LPS O-acetylase OafA/YrhL
VGITPLPPPARPQTSHSSAFVAGGVYALLFLLGLIEGVLGSFQYSRGAAGSVPVGAIAFAVLILVTCGAAGWAMQTTGGALLPAIGWFVASFGLAMPNSGGSVIIANTAPGEWYLYGGSICALAGVASSFVTMSRSPRNRMAGRNVPPV